MVASSVPRIRLNALRVWRAGDRGRTGETIRDLEEFERQNVVAPFEAAEARRRW